MAIIRCIFVSLECEVCFNINLDLLLAIDRVVSEKDLSLVSVECISIIVSHKYSISNTVFEKRKDNRRRVNCRT